MSNMTDYLRWRGDITLEERPLNDVDALVLATVSYLDFDDIVPPDVSGGIALGDACQEVLARTGDDITSAVRSMASIDTSFVVALAQSERFGSLCMSRYLDQVDEATSLQFSAVTIGLPGGDLLISFRGTDSTLVGWREDFMLAFTVTEAQRMARAYLKDALAGSGAGARVVLAGHSKGGCLAEYAAATCPEALLSRIGRVYSFDGPGLDRAVLSCDAFSRMGERFRRILPRFSVVGQLMDRLEVPRRYVESSEWGIMQHDPMSWQVGPAGLVQADGLAPEAKTLDDAIASWLSGEDLETRELFVRELFDILGAGGATTIAEVVTNGGVQRVIAAAAQASEGTKQVIGRLIDTSMQATKESVASGVADGVEGIAHVVKRTGENLASRIGESLMVREAATKVAEMGEMLGARALPGETERSEQEGPADGSGGGSEQDG